MCLALAYSGLLLAQHPVAQAPDWPAVSFVYQVFPRSFADHDGDGTGDLKGLAGKLDYIRGLGAEALWITPHYPAPSNHGYDPTDCAAVNPQFGNAADFRALADGLHRRGMRLIVDYVANHCSNRHPLFRDAFRNPASKHSALFRFREGNAKYDGFFGLRFMPAWNTANPEVERLHLSWARHWLDAGADGLRLDHVPGPAPAFWRSFNGALRKSHPNALLLGELWDENPAKVRVAFDWGFHALFDFPWHLEFAKALNGGAQQRFRAAGSDSAAGLAAGRMAFRFTENHDTDRTATALAGDPRKLRLAAALLLLGPGTPVVYYGQEIGMRGAKGDGKPFGDEPRREPMDWHADETGPGTTTWHRPAQRHNRPRDGISVAEQDRDPAALLNWYRRLGKLRRDSPTLRTGSCRYVFPDPAQRWLACWREIPRGLSLTAWNLGPEPVALPWNALEPPPRLPGEPIAALGAAPQAGAAQLEGFGTLHFDWPRP